MTMMVPTERKLALQSYTDLMPKKEDGISPTFTMPEWFEPLLKVSYFLHFFRDEMRMPGDLMKEIFATMMESHLEGAMDNIVVIRKVPKMDLPKESDADAEQSTTYSKKWIVERVFALLVKHQAIVLDADRDIKIVDDEEDPTNFVSIVVFIDGFSHLREMDHEADEDDDTSKMLKLLHSETDDEAEDAEPKIEEEKKEPVKEAGPTAWSCPICTFENEMSAGTCTICMSGQRPSQQELEAQAAEAQAIAKQEAKEAKEEANQGVVKEPLHQTRLKMLARDIRHMISHDQR